MSSQCSLAAHSTMTKADSTAPRSRVALVTVVLAQDAWPVRARTRSQCRGCPGGSRTATTGSPPATADGRAPALSNRSSLLAIDREAEWSNSVAAAAAGVAPRSSNVSPSGRASGRRVDRRRDLTAADLDDSRKLAAVAAACRQLHAGPRVRRRLRHVRRAAPLPRLVRDQGFRLPPALRRLPAGVARIRARWPPPRPTRCRATTTCWPRTSSTTASGSGSSTSSTPATTTRSSSSATLERGHLGPDRLEELVAAYCGRHVTDSRPRGPGCTG